MTGLTKPEEWLAGIYDDTGVPPSAGLPQSQGTSVVWDVSGDRWRPLRRSVPLL